MTDTDATRAAWRTEQAEQVLAALIPARYRLAYADHHTIVEWAGYVGDREESRSLLLVGDIGTGKTWQAYGALRAAVMTAARRGDVLTPAAITHADLNDEVRPGGEGLDRFLAADVLLLDDLGAAHVTAWNADAAYRLIDHRWAHQLPTILTSNLAAADITAVLGPRLTSRLVGMCQRVALTGADRRQT